MEEKKRQEAEDGRQKVSVSVINPDLNTGTKTLGALHTGDTESRAKVVDQEVYVLDGGFVKWQEKCATPLCLPRCRLF